MLTEEASGHRTYESYGSVSVSEDGSTSLSNKDPRSNCFIAINSYDQKFLQVRKTTVVYWMHIISL